MLQVSLVEDFLFAEGRYSTGHRAVLVTDLFQYFLDRQANKCPNNWKAWQMMLKAEYWTYTEQSAAVQHVLAGLVSDNQVNWLLQQGLSRQGSCLSGRKEEPGWGLEAGKALQEACSSQPVNVMCSLSSKDFEVIYISEYKLQFTERKLRSRNASCSAQGHCSPTLLLFPTWQQSLLLDGEVGTR